MQYDETDLIEGLLVLLIASMPFIDDKITSKVYQNSLYYFNFLPIMIGITKIRVIDYITA
jgi:hypothetical protein